MKTSLDHNVRSAEAALFLLLLLVYAVLFYLLSRLNGLDVGHWA